MQSLLKWILLIHRWFQFIKQLSVNDWFEWCDMWFNVVTRGHLGVYISVNIASVNIVNSFPIICNMCCRVRSSGSFNEIQCLSYVNLVVLYALVVCILKSAPSEHYTNCSFRHIASTRAGSRSTRIFTNSVGRTSGRNLVPNNWSNCSLLHTG